MHSVIQTDPIIHEIKQVTRFGLAIGHTRRNPSGLVRNVRINDGFLLFL